MSFGPMREVGSKVMDSKGWTVVCARPQASVGISCIRAWSHALSFSCSTILLLLTLLKYNLEGIPNGLGLFCLFVFELNQELQNMCWIFALWFGRE